MVYVDNRGRCPTLDFLDNLGDKEKQCFLALIEAFADRGEIRNTEKFRNEGDGIYAFKYKGYRILCFFLDSPGKKSIVLTHGFKKKGPKILKQEKEKTDRIRKGESGIIR